MLLKFADHACCIIIIKSLLPNFNNTERVMNNNYEWKYAAARCTAVQRLREEHSIMSIRTSVIIGT